MNNKENIVIRDLEDFAVYMGVDIDRNTEVEEIIERIVYKSTNCGAWVKFTETGIILGSIVEGSDAEVDTDELKFPFTSEHYERTIEYIEGEVDILWNEANCEESEDDED